MKILSQKFSFLRLKVLYENFLSWKFGAIQYISIDKGVIIVYSATQGIHLFPPVGGTSEQVDKGNDYCVLSREWDSNELGDKCIPTTSMW